jgi:hypothetical protein
VLLEKGSPQSTGREKVNKHKILTNLLFLRIAQPEGLIVALK